MVEYTFLFILNNMDKNNNQKKKSNSKKPNDYSESDSNRDKVEIEKNEERRKYKQANNKINTRRENEKEGNRGGKEAGGAAGHRQDKEKNRSAGQDSKKSIVKNKSKIKGSSGRKNKDRQTSSTSSTTTTSISSSESDSSSDISSSSSTTLDTQSDKSFSARIVNRKKNKRPRTGNEPAERSRAFSRVAGSKISSRFVKKLDDKKVIKNGQKKDDASNTLSSNESSMNRGKKSNRHRRALNDDSEYTIRDTYRHGNDNIGQLGKKESALIEKIIKVFSDNQDLYKKNISLENKVLDCQQKIIKRSRNPEVLELISKIFKLDRDINVINTIILKSNLPKRINQNASLVDKLSSQYVIVCDVNQEYKSDLKSNNSKCEFYNKIIEFSETEQIKKFRAEKDRLEKILDKLKVDAKLSRF